MHVFRLSKHCPAQLPTFAWPVVIFFGLPGHFDHRMTRQEPACSSIKVVLVVGLLSRWKGLGRPQHYSRTLHWIIWERQSTSRREFFFLVLFLMRFPRLILLG
jgi:hypothetical protein